MCVRYFSRRRCQSSKKTFRKKLRPSPECHKLLSKSKPSGGSRDHARLPACAPEAVDLFCPESLPMLDPQSCQVSSDAAAAAVEPSDLPTDELRLVAPMTTPSSSSSSDPGAAFNAKSPPGCNVKDGVWHDIDGMPQMLPSLRPRAADPRHGLADGGGWHNFCPDPGSQPGLGAVKRRGWHLETAASFISSGNSRQSNYLPCERWPVRARAPLSLPSTRTACHDRRQPTKPSSSFRINGTMRLPDDHDFSCPSKFGEAMGILLEKETASCFQLSKPYIDRLTENSAQKLEHNELRDERRAIVNWIFEVTRLLQLSSLSAAHAVSFLDRYLSQRFFPDAEFGANVDIRLAATACIWIAAKLEDSGAPDLSSMRELFSLDYDEEKIRKMEVSVLKCLGWRMLAVTALDFLANMVAQLPAFGLPTHLLRPVGHRSEEIMQGLLSEVEFLAYQPSVVSMSVMQCLLDECVPVHTASIMAAFHLALAFDVESEKVCHRTLMDLVVDPDLVCSLPSPDRVDCASSREEPSGCFQWTDAIGHRYLLSTSTSSSLRSSEILKC
ncbi:protein MpCYCD_2 [Marchantia polymorpha subsp. ruderalis]